MKKLKTLWLDHQQVRGTIPLLLLLSVILGKDCWSKIVHKEDKRKPMLYQYLVNNASPHHDIVKDVNQFSTESPRPVRRVIFYRSRHIFSYTHRIFLHYCISPESLPKHLTKSSRNVCLYLVLIL